jgi:hypothetical protein
MRLEAEGPPDPGVRAQDGQQRRLIQALARMLATGASPAVDGWLAPGQLLCTLAPALEVSAGMRTSGTEVACSIH